jgi:4-hydroxy-4-methyl-2-oxoglutarate aldolase
MRKASQIEEHGDQTIYTRIPRVETDLAQSFAAYGVAALVDAIGRDLAPRQVMDESMVRRTTSQTVAGSAVTARVVPGDNLMMHVALELAGSGDVIVVAGSMSGAQWGALTTHRAQAQGVRGAVVDGPVRDLDAIRSLSFAVWSTSVSPNGATKISAGAVNCPVRCAGVLVYPGDIMVADGDGVVVIPRRMAESVKTGAEKQVSAERARLREPARGRWLERAPQRSTGVVDGTWEESAGHAPDEPEAHREA